MTFLFFFISQTIIPDFQVNSEDYPGSTLQLYPSIACNDSGGAIIWYDLRAPANGMVVFGTLINASGDTINKNFRLNEDTTAGCASLPAIDNDSAGNFTIVYIQNSNVLARRFNKIGAPYGPSFIVNSSPNCAYPSIAVLPQGRFIIAWLQSGENKIYGQIFDASGNPVGTNFIVSDSAIPYIYNIPSIGNKSNGDFIISWQYKNEIWAQIFDSLGNRIGENFRIINDTLSTGESYPKLRFDSQDNLFVCWMATVEGQGDINCQIFDSTLTPITDIIKIDGNDIDSARYPAVAIRDSIWFIVFQNGINTIYLQRVNNNGELIGSNIRISEQIGRSNTLAKIDCTQNHFVVTWSWRIVGTICNIMCQKVSFDGNLIGTNYVITDDKGGDAQCIPSVVAHGDGGFFVVWADWRRAPDYYNVPHCYGRIYNQFGNPYGDEFRINTHANADYPTIGINSNIYLVAWARTNPDSNRQIYAQRFDYNGNLIGTNYQISLSSGTNGLSIPKITTLSNNNFVVVWNENIATIDKIYGRILDGTGIPYGQQFNPYVDSSGYNRTWSAVDEGNGKFIVPILCSDTDSVVAAIKEFDYNGNPVSEPIKLNDSPPHYSYVCGAKGINRYIFLWIGAGQTKIVGQLLDDNFQKIGNNFIISDDTTAYKDFCSVVSNSNGKFFAVWENNHNSESDLYGQFFDSLGNRIGNNFRVDNDTTNAIQSFVSCFSANNRIYIVWGDTRTPTHWYDIYCKVIGWPDGQEIVEQERDNGRWALEVHPNPFRERLDIRYRIPDTGCKVQDIGGVGEVRRTSLGISLAIYDVTGRLVKSFNHLINSSFNHVVWFGDDDSGHQSPPGVYFVQLEVGDFRQIEKVILLK